MDRNSREIDGLVAEHVLGFRREKIGPDYDGKYGGTECLIAPTCVTEADYRDMLPRRGAVPLWYFAPDVSTDLRQAMWLWDKMFQRGWECSLTRDATGKWMFSGVKHADKKARTKEAIFVATAETREMAIALGVLDSAGLKP